MTPPLGEQRWRSPAQKSECPRKVCVRVCLGGLPATPSQPPGGLGGLPGELSGGGQPLHTRGRGPEPAGHFPAPGRVCKSGRAAGSGGDPAARPGDSQFLPAPLRGAPGSPHFPAGPAGRPVADPGAVRPAAAAAPRAGESWGEAGRGPPNPHPAGARISGCRPACRCRLRPKRAAGFGSPAARWLAGKGAPTPAAMHLSGRP